MGLRGQTKYHRQVVQCTMGKGLIYRGFGRSLCFLMSLFSLTIVLSVLLVLITRFSIFKQFLRRILCSQNNIHCIFIDTQTWEPIRSHRDCMVVGFTTTYVISAYHHWCCEFESRSGRGVQHYEIKFVSELWQIISFLRFLRFPPPIKLTATI